MKTAWKTFYASPLHQCLYESDPEEKVIECIERYPEALTIPDKEYNLPIHIECLELCRLKVISKCIELRPESSAVENGEQDSVLHLILENKQQSTIAAVMLVIDKYPDALRHLNDRNSLPLHYECICCSRLPIIAKCIDLYPESLDMHDNMSHLPLHLLLRNTSSSTEVALYLIDRFPEALRRAECNGNLPIHLECLFQCRIEVISKCLELYPDSARIPNDKEGMPFTIILHRAARLIWKAREVMRNHQKILSVILPLFPRAFYYPLDKPLVNDVPKYFGFKRMVFNLLPSCLSFPEHSHHHQIIQSYHDLNWEPRSPLLYLWLQLARKSNLFIQEQCKYRSRRPFIG
jgi:hypothetical protein